MVEPDQGGGERAFLEAGGKPAKNDGEVTNDAETEETVTIEAATERNATMFAGEEATTEEDYDLHTIIYTDTVILPETETTKGAAKSD